MDNKFSVKIISPSKTIFDSQANMVNIPGKEGMFGVLAGHAKLISNVDIGIITVFCDNSQRNFFVYEAVAKISQNELDILTDFAIDLSNTSQVNIMNKIDEIKDSLTNLQSDSMEFKIFQDKLKKYQALVKVM